MNRNKWILVMDIVLLAVCVVMIAVGFRNGEADVVLMKARNICMECIGIG